MATSAEEKQRGIKVLSGLEDIGCCGSSKIAFTCCAQSTLENLYQSYDDHKNQDFGEHAHQDFSLFSRLHEAPTNADGTHEGDVELEDVHNEDQVHHTHEDSRGLQERQEAATKRFKELFYPLIPTGCVLYALTLGGGFLGGFFCQCADGPSPVAFIFPVAAIAVLIYQLNKTTILLSRTKVENRPLLTLLMSLKGIDNYYVLTIFACVDTFSRWSRAQFVGYLAQCHDQVEATFESVLFYTEKGENKYSGLMVEMIEAIGFSTLAVIGFIIGPILIQFGYMYYLKRKLDQEMQEMTEKTETNEHKDMEMMDSIDDLGAMMGWAMLVPAGRVLDLATIPTDLGNNPAENERVLVRIWDRIQTQVKIMLARNIPDGILQLNVQAWFLCLVIRGLDTSNCIMMMVNIAGACVGVIGDSVELLIANRRLTVCAAFLMLFLLVPGFVRITMAFTCASGVATPGAFKIFLLDCVPLDILPNATWSSGTLPG
jgi:hypothetical protein